METDKQHDEMYAAYALYTDDTLAWHGGREFTPGVYWQEFVTFSTSLTGIKSALNNYYKFKMTTPIQYQGLKNCNCTAPF